MSTNKLRILNFVPDEKFIDGVINIDKLMSDETHRYIKYSCNKDSALNLIKQKNLIEIKNQDQILELLSQRDYDAVFLHSLNVVPSKVIKKIPSSIPTFWFSWGYDIYGSPLSGSLIQMPLLHKYTSKYLEKSFSNTWKSKIKRLSFVSYLLNELRLRKKRALFKHIDFHSGVLPYETELLKKHNPEFKAKQVQYNYISSPAPSVFTKPTGQNILIGNSAALTNNHLDIIRILRQIDLKGRELIVPLSYAAISEKYVEKVIREFKDSFGNNALTLNSFLTIQKYTEIISSCSYAIFYIERQQAIGNIYQCFASGKKVFLSESSQMFSYFKSIGMVVFSIQSDLIKENAFTPLSDKEMLNNYNIWLTIHKQWKNNRDKIHKEILSFKHTL